MSSRTMRRKCWNSWSLIVDLFGLTSVVPHSAQTTADLPVPNSAMPNLENKRNTLALNNNQDKVVAQNWCW